MESIKNNANKGNSNKREMNLKPPDPKKTLNFADEYQRQLNILRE